MARTSNYNLFESFPVPMWIFDLKTLRFLDVNVAAIEHYGFSKAEFLSMNINSIKSEEDIEGIERMFERNSKIGQIYKNTVKHIKKSGDHIYVEIECSLIKFKGAQATLVLVHDVTGRIIAEQRLELSEQRFKALVQGGSDLIAIVDLDLNYKYVSPTSLRLLGIHPKDFLGHSALEFIHEDDVEMLKKEASELNTVSEVSFTPFRFRNAKGEWRWIETRATNLMDDKAISGIVCNSRDITERVAQQKEIVENVERYNIVSKATCDAIWDYDLHTNKVSWNRGINGILKYKLIGHVTDVTWWKNNIHPEDRERILLKMSQHLESGVERWEDEYRFLCGDGIYRYILDRGYVGFDVNNKPYRMIGAMQDVTKRIEEEHWSKLLESVVINTTDGVLITDASFNPGPIIIYVNDALVKMSGYSREELIGKTADIFHGSNAAQQGLQKIEVAIGSQKACNTELINYTKDGKPFDVSINICPITNSNNEVTHWISIQRDITENRQYVRAIEDQNKKLRDIAWIQSHSVRAPLTKIMSLVDLLTNGCIQEDNTLLLKYLSESSVELDKVITRITKNAC